MIHKIERNTPLSSSTIIPIRLEIASKLLAGMCANPTTTTITDLLVKGALDTADSLIETHNKTAESEDEL